MLSVSGSVSFFDHVLKQKPFFFLEKTLRILSKDHCLFLLCFLFLLLDHCHAPILKFPWVFFSNTQIGPKKTWILMCDICFLFIAHMYGEKLVLWKKPPKSRGMPGLPSSSASRLRHPASHPGRQTSIVSVIQKNKELHQFITPYDMMNKKPMELGNFYFFGRGDPEILCFFSWVLCEMFAYNMSVTVAVDNFCWGAKKMFPPPTCQLPPPIEKPVKECRDLSRFFKG